MASVSSTYMGIKKDGPATQPVRGRREITFSPRVCRQGMTTSEGFVQFGAGGGFLPNGLVGA